MEPLSDTFLFLIILKPVIPLPQTYFALDRWRGAHPIVPLTDPQRTQVNPLMFKYRTIWGTFGPVWTLWIHHRLYPLCWRNTTFSHQTPFLMGHISAPAGNGKTTYRSKWSPSCPLQGSTKWLDLVVGVAQGEPIRGGCSCSQKTWSLWQWSDSKLKTWK